MSILFFSNHRLNNLFSLLYLFCKRKIISIVFVDRFLYICSVSQKGSGKKDLRTLRVPFFYLMYIYNKKMNKRTQEEYEDAIKSSHSIAEALRKLNIIDRGGNYRIIKMVLLVRSLSPLQKSHNVDIPPYEIQQILRNMNRLIY